MRNDGDHTRSTRGLPATPCHIRRLQKPDGRSLVLYSRVPLPADIAAPCPTDDTAHVSPNPHLRFHPLRREWVAYAAHRQGRTFLPPPEYNPLAPTADPAHPTELPAGGYDVAVFENRFPTFFSGAHDPPTELVPTLPARGACEVVVFTQDAKASLGTLPQWHVELLVEAWADRHRALAARDDVAYVFPFENRGVEVGVTLHHPHGQIYAYPFVPPLAERELSAQRDHLAATGRGLLQDMIAMELQARDRIVVEAGLVVAFVPVCARYAYELWIAPLRPAESVAELTPQERRDLAACLRVALQKLDGLWGRPMPYVMAFHSAPTDGLPHPEAHFHIEIYPAYRMPGRLKYLAGSEVGAGVFTADTLPEVKARELRNVEVSA